MYGGNIFVEQVCPKMGDLHPFWQFWYRENDDSIGVWQVKTGSWPTQKLVLTRFDQQMASLTGLSPTKGTVYV